jgi:citrate lyase beta subunit
MVPFVGSASEFAACEAIVREEFARIAHERKTRVRISVGAMIEVPRAALTAGEIAESADFFSFGTNDYHADHFRGGSGRRRMGKRALPRLPRGSIPDGGCDGGGAVDGTGG